MNSEIDPPSVTTVLKSAFGQDFERATLRQKLVVLEAVAILLRDSADTFGDALDIAVSDDESINIPREIDLYSDVFESPKEGLQLMGILYSAIIEDYAVLRATNAL
jgi:hypothetical protein